MKSCPEVKYAVVVGTSVTAVVPALRASDSHRSPRPSRRIGVRPVGGEAAVVRDVRDAHDTARLQHRDGAARQVDALERVRRGDDEGGTAVGREDRALGAGGERRRRERAASVGGDEVDRARSRRQEDAHVRGGVEEERVGRQVDVGRAREIVRAEHVLQGRYGDGPRAVLHQQPTAKEARLRRARAVLDDVREWCVEAARPRMIDGVDTEDTRVRGRREVVGDVAGAIGKRPRPDGQHMVGEDHGGAALAPDGQLSDATGGVVLDEHEVAGCPRVKLLIDDEPRGSVGEPERPRWTSRQGTGDDHGPAVDGSAIVKTDVARDERGRSHVGCAGQIRRAAAVAEIGVAEIGAVSGPDAAEIGRVVREAATAAASDGERRREHNNSKGAHGDDPQRKKKARGAQRDFTQLP